MKLKSVPKHIGIILDGNGRWAIKKKKPRMFGHTEGVNALKRTLSAAKKLGIKVVSVFAFSTENWKRPKDEVNGIFKLLENFLDKSSGSFVENGYKLNIMGDISKLSPVIQNKLNNLVEKSKDNSALVFNLGINYGGRAEIVSAVNQILKENKKEVCEEEFEKYLHTASLPPLDFVIRTSGEQRLSNFMLWQVAYAELYFPKFFWPSFNEQKLIKCLKVFQKRNRRFGDVKR